MMGREREGRGERGKGTGKVKRRGNLLQGVRGDRRL